LDDSGFWQTSASYDAIHVSEVQRRRQLGLWGGLRVVGKTQTPWAEFETSTRIDHVLRLENRDGTETSSTLGGVEGGILRRFIYWQGVSSSCITLKTLFPR